MRRKLSFTGFILSTCFVSVLAILQVFGFIALLCYGDEMGVPSSIWVITGISMAISIATLILNALSIPATASAQKMQKKKGIVITSIVFNFVLVLLCILSLITGIETVVLIIYIFMLIALITTNVLVIIDLAKISKAINEGVNPDEKQVKKTENKVTNEAKEDGTNNLEEEINKLILMRAKNLISDEEFDKLKSHAIEKH